MYKDICCSVMHARIHPTLNAYRLVRRVILNNVYVRVYTDGYCTVLSSVIHVRVGVVMGHGSSGLFIAQQGP